MTSGETVTLPRRATRSLNATASLRIGWPRWERMTAFAFLTTLLLL